VTLEEAEYIARNYLPDEPRPDEISSWRASQPRPEPARGPRGLDTAPAPQVDVADVIKMALRAERDLMTEAVGGALAEYTDNALSEVDAEIQKLRTEVDQLRSEFSQANELREIRAQLAEIKEMLAKKARGRKIPPLQLPAPNGDASRPQ
jgi:hypothetical protein